MSPTSRLIAPASSWHQSVFGAAAIDLLLEDVLVPDLNKEDVRQRAP
jgi:hypothetical protein